MGARSDERSRRGESTAWVFFVLLAVATPALAGLGCGELDDVTGVWRTLDQPLALDLEAPKSPCLDGSYVQLVAGQYGSEVAGVIKFFDSPQFTEERCPCSFLYSGRLKGSTLTFDFRQPDEDDEDEDVWLRAVLQLIPAEEPLLTGDVYLIDPDENLRCGALILDGQPRQGLSDELKRCNPDEPGTWTPEGADDTVGGEGNDA